MRAASLVVIMVAAVGFGACSGDDSTEETLAPLVTTTTSTTTTTTTTIAPTTTPALATTTTSTTTTSTTSTTSTTTTTIPRSAELVMRQDGIGDATFGVNTEEVIDYITSIAGAPTSDSGWADPFSAFGVCPGTEVRGLTWGDLLVLFSDESTVASGRRHFFSYSYGPPFTDTPRPAAMRTPEGITVGSTVAELRAAYPEVIVTPGDDIFLPHFHVSDNLNGFLTGDTDADSVQSIIGGVGCGE